MSELLLALSTALIRKHEGLRLTVYDDADGVPLRPGRTLKGHPTVGYGRNLEARGISADEALLLLQNDVLAAMAIAERYLGPTVWRELGDVRRAVLVDMAHNLGALGLGKFRTLRECIACGDYAGAAQAMESSRWYGQVGTRAKRLTGMMRTGHAPTLAELA